jgi:hypothetical protein
MTARQLTKGHASDFAVGAELFGSCLKKGLEDSPNFRWEDSDAVSESLFDRNCFAKIRLLGFPFQELGIFETEGVKKIRWLRMFLF